MDDLTGEYVHTINQPVKTLRDEFAMAALTGLLTCPNIDFPSCEQFADHAYKFADAMLKARTEQP